MKLVNKENYSNCVNLINSTPNIAIDTETTGLKPYNGDRLFSIIVSTDEEDYYFNYNPNGPTLDRSTIPTIISEDYSGRIFFHNAKFDMKMLEHEGLNLRNHRIYDTAGLARIDFNDRIQLSLASLAPLVGQKKKTDQIKDYIKNYKKEHKVDINYSEVPFELMSDYACEDGNITLKLGKRFLQSIAQQDKNKQIKNSLNLKNIVQTENRLTPILMDMQDRGMKLDVKYTKEAIEYEKQNYLRLAKEYEEISGVPFRDSNKNHSTAFTAIGEKFPLTEKGNPSFNKEALSSMDNRLSNVIKEYRTSYKKVHTYFENFLNIKDTNDIIHANLNQYQARTGRFSSSDPNLQNLNRGSKNEKYPVRGCFVPHEGESIAYLDYSQLEYRAMLNKAKEWKMIEQILGGLDVHTATSELMGVPRQQAKTINFLLLYGGGLTVLARALFTTHLSEHTLKKIQELKFFRDFLWSNDHIANHMALEYWEVEHGVEILTKARDLKELYFSSLPAVKIWVDNTVNAAKRGFIYNDYGRAYKFNKNFAFKSPNYAIQGFTADLIKKVMIDCNNYLIGNKSKMLLQVHDELQFGIVSNENHIITDLAEVMTVNPFNEPLTYEVDAEQTFTRWSEKKELIL